MGNYNSFEKMTSSLLSSSPGIKRGIKFAYQTINYLFNKKEYQFQSEFPIHAISTFNEETFFGYYDKSPENSDGKYIIYHKVRGKTSKNPTPNLPVQILIKDTQNNKEEIIGESLSYNWQQGTKLQWLTNEKFIYNIFEIQSNSYKSRVINAYTKKEEAVINFPIYDCFGDQFALSLNFNRLALLRPDYGYRNKHEKIDLKNCQNDGIYFIDLQNNVSFLLVSIQDVVNASHVNTMINATHKINHIMISPDGEKFMFLHRWFIPEGKRFDRLLVCDKNGLNIKILNDNGMVSHCCWYDANTIVGYFRHSSYGNSYYRIDLETSKVTLLSSKLLGFSDGHPTFFGSQMVFDSYPDRSRFKQLYLFDLENDTLRNVGEFLEPLEYFGETRCDLHPKWNQRGTKIFIDSVHEGLRSLYEIDLEK